MQAWELFSERVPDFAMNLQTMASTEHINLLRHLGLSDKFKIFLFERVFLSGMTVIDIQG